MYKQKTLFGLALALIAIVMGTALAMWFEKLTVDVTVETGSVDISVQAECNEAPEAEGKNVGSCEAEVDGNSVTVTISNAYPGYSADVTITVSNVGSIPVDLLGGVPSVPSEYTIPCNQQGAGPLYVTLSGPEDDTQIDPPGWEDTSDTYILHIEVCQAAEENQQYGFTLTFNFAQWNEV